LSRLQPAQSASSIRLKADPTGQADPTQEF
jgi:hypothetical protein